MSVGVGWYSNRTCASNGTQKPQQKSPTRVTIRIRARIISHRISYRCAHFRNDREAGRSSKELHESSSSGIPLIDPVLITDLLSSLAEEQPVA
jgi:hypothetical protein